MLKIGALTARSEFRSLYKEGRRVYPSFWLVVVYKQNHLEGFRFAWSVPRFVGTAVLRNKFKRWLRAYLRTPQLEHQLEPRLDTHKSSFSGREYDISFILKRVKGEHYKTLSYYEFTKTVQKGLKEALQNRQKKPNKPWHKTRFPKANPGSKI